MNIESPDQELFLESIFHQGKQYYRDREGNIFNSNSVLENLKFDFKESKQTNQENMATVTLSNALTSEIYKAMVGEIFAKYEGKKVGEDFTIQNFMEDFNISGDPPDLEISKKKSNEKKEKVKKEKKEKKEKNPRKPSAFSIYCKDNKDEILQKTAQIRENGDSTIKWLKVAGDMWKEVSTEDKKKFEEKASQ